jgi:hypothetical protein
MQRLEISGAVRPLYGSLGIKGLIHFVVFVWDKIKIGNPHTGDSSQISKVYSTNLQKCSSTTPWSSTYPATIRIAQLVEKLTIFVEPKCSSLFTTLNQQAVQTCSLNTYIIMAYLIFLHVPVHKGNQTDVMQQKTKSVTFLYCWLCVTVKWLKWIHFFVKVLYICVGSWYTVFWKLPTHLTEASTVASRQPCTLATIWFYGVLLCLIRWCRSLADRNV